MTCIAAVIHRGAVYMGGDSVGVDTNHGRAVRLDSKVFRGSLPTWRGALPCVLGFTCSFRMGQILRYSLKLPKLAEGDDLHGFMCTSFVDQVRDAFHSGGWGKHEADADGAAEGGEFLFGIGGRLFKVESDFQVGEMSDGYAACGCGEDLALGALYMTKTLPPHTRLAWALSAASHHNAGVGAPFRYVDTAQEGA